MRFHIKNATKRQGQHFAKLIREFDLPVFRIETFETLVDANGDKVGNEIAKGKYSGQVRCLAYGGGKFAAKPPSLYGGEVDFHEFRRRIFDLAGKPYKKTFREWLIGF